MRQTIAGLTILSLALCAGCTTTEMVSFNIDSEPAGARIEVNGLDRGVTPTTVQLEMRKTWSPFAPGGWSVRSTEYEFVAYPPEAAGPEHPRQSKMINMKHSSRGGKMFFDFKRIEPAK